MFLFYISIILGVVMVMLFVRYAVKAWFPNAGTIVANAIGFAPIVPIVMGAFDIAANVPWAAFLSPREAAMVSAGVMVANMIIAKLKNDEVKALGP